MKTRSEFLLLTILFLIALLGGCAPPQVFVPVERPAEIDLGDIRQIAIGRFTGDGGIDIAEDLTAELSASSRFQVIDRNKVDRLIQENRLASDGLIDQETAIKLGKLLGVAALVYGRVALYEFQEQTDSRTWKDKDNRSHRTYTRHGTATVEVAFNVIELETGRILSSKKIVRRYSDKASKIDARPPAIDDVPLFIAARRAVVQAFMKSIAPYEEAVQVKLLTDKKIPELERGIALIKIREWHEALDVFKNAVEEHPDNPKALYNLGIAYKYTFQFDEAEEYLKAAYMIDHNSLFEQEINHLRQMREEAESSVDVEPVLITPSATVVDEPIDDYGDEPLDLAWVQRKLNELGHNCGAADGIMGPNTRRCIRAYQEASNLSPTGRLDDATSAALRRLK